MRHCQNRRHGCSLGLGGCPQGYFCLNPLHTEQFCVRTVEPCTVVGDCHFLREGCADADGDGTTECLATGACTPVIDAGSTVRSVGFLRGVPWVLDRDGLLRSADDAGQSRLL